MRLSFGKIGIGLAAATLALAVSTPAARAQTSTSTWLHNRGDCVRETSSLLSPAASSVTSFGSSNNIFSGISLNNFGSVQRFNLYTQQTYGGTLYIFEVTGGGSRSCINFAGVGTPAGGQALNNNSESYQFP